MVDEDPAEVARKIVDAYRASGIPAKIHGGRPFVCREEGWEGPLDTLQLREIYEAEIGRIERDVRGAVAACWEMIDQRRPGALDRDLWVALRVCHEDFKRLGFSEQKAQLYSSVAQCLRYRREL